MKITKWIYVVVLVLFVFSFNSCFFYQTIPLEEISADNLDAIAKQKQFITLENKRGTERFHIEDYVLENGSIKGNLKKMDQSDHPGDRRLYLRSSGKYSKSYLHLYTNLPLKNGPLDISINDINGVDSHKNDKALSIFTNSFLIAFAAMVGTGAYLWYTCSCPHVATFNPDGTSQFQGSLFPGSIFKPLKRKDYLVLDHVQKNDDDLLTVQVFNDLDEVQYIDQVELLAVQHAHSRVGLIQNSELMAYEVGELPIEATSQIGNSALEEISTRDDNSYDFDDPAMEEHLNSLELSFKVSSLKKDALLVVRAQQTELLEQTAEVFFQQFGSKFPTWVEKMNNKESSNYNQNSIDQGISLNAYILKNSEWHYLGSYENVGTSAYRDLAIPVDIDGMESDVRIKLETAYGFWSIDQITLTNDWSTDLNINPLELISAINQDGKDVMKSLINTDEDYLVQAFKGTSTDLKFESASSSKVTYVLSGNGYYNHERSYSNSPNYRALRKMKREKFATHNLAQKVQLYKDLHLASKN